MATSIDRFSAIRTFIQTGQKAVVALVGQIYIVPTQIEKFRILLRSFSFEAGIRILTSRLRGMAMTEFGLSTGR